MGVLREFDFGAGMEVERGAGCGGTHKGCPYDWGWSGVGAGGQVEALQVGVDPLIGTG